MASASFSVDVELTAHCTRCGIERDFPEQHDEAPVRMPTHGADGGVTVFADTPCGCGCKRVKLDFDLGFD